MVRKYLAPSEHSRHSLINVNRGEIKTKLRGLTPIPVVPMVPETFFQ